MASRRVLAPDGVAERADVDARARGLLAGVTPAFPSIRDVSLLDIVGVKRLAGYSWILDGARQKAVVGGIHRGGC